MYPTSDWDPGSETDGLRDPLVLLLVPGWPSVCPLAPAIVTVCK
ncbi:hypothetical protein NW849_02160 [Synechococcus sp. R55.3]